jgi:hypothetical protein
LSEHIEDGRSFRGVLVGVDGKKLGLKKKTAALKAGVAGTVQLPDTILWSVASPCIEEWMMADAEALPAALRELLGDPGLEGRRPGRASAETTAKERLRGWIRGLVGGRLLRGGLEYAEEVAGRVEPSRVGRRRNPDLKDLLDTRLPEFLAQCASR